MVGTARKRALNNMARGTAAYVLWGDLTRQPVDVTLATDLQSSEGGTPMPGSVGHIIGLTRVLAVCTKERRPMARSRHSLRDLLHKRLRPVPWLR